MTRLCAPPAELFLGGSWRPAADGATAEVVDPTDGSVIREVAWAGPEDVDRAVAATEEAYQDWSGRPAEERAGILHRIADRLLEDAERLAAIDSLDSGNPLRASLADIRQAARMLRFFAGLGPELTGRSYPTTGGDLAFTRRRPYPVVGRILAFNHPLLFAVQSSAGPLMAGCALISKPSDPTPLAALEFAALVEDLLPPGVLSVLPGTGPAAGEALVAHPRVPRIAFTGSVATGRRILAVGAEHIKHVTVELGGKNPLLVFPDADVEAAADAAVRGMNLTSTNGQSCMSTSRLFVHEDVHDEVVAAVAQRFRSLRIGRPSDPDTEVGPLAFQSHHERVLGFIERARAAGARLVTGGDRPPGLPEGYYLEPTLFTEVDPGMELAREEIFGPVLAVLRWRDPQELLAAANALDLGLTANVWTRDLATALATIERLDAGLVWVNGPVPRPAGLPFGGVKQSGLGREHCREELLSYTEERSIVVHASDPW